MRASSFWLGLLVPLKCLVLTFKPGKEDTIRVRVWSVRATACAVDLWTWNFSILSLWPLVHYFFFCWDFSDESWHLLQFGVGIHSARRWERTNFAFGCEDNYECVCRMSEWKHVDWKLLDAEPTLPLILMSCIFSTLDLGFFWRFRRFLNSGTLPSRK